MNVLFKWLALAAIAVMAGILSYHYTTPASAAEPTAIKLAEFKGDCMRMKGTLKYENNRWACHASKESDPGLVSIPVYYPRFWPDFKQ